MLRFVVIVLILIAVLLLEQMRIKNMFQEMYIYIEYFFKTANL